MPLIAVEGGDGAGKRTVAERFASTLVERGAAAVVLESFPRYGTPLGQEIRESLVAGKSAREYAVERALLFALDRFRFIENIALDSYVIVDRWVASNAAYLSAVAGDDSLLDWVVDLEHGKLGIPVPDLSIIVQARSVNRLDRIEARARADSRRESDAFERDVNLQSRVTDQYLKCQEIAELGAWVAIQNTSTVESLHRRVDDLVSNFIGDHEIVGRRP